MPTHVSTADLTAHETGCTWVQIDKGGFNFSLSGTWAATVHLQRTFDRGTTPLDIDSFTANTELVGTEPEGCMYRFYIKNGNYTSGTVEGRISQHAIREM